MKTTEMLTVNEAAELAGLPRSTFTRKAKEYNIPSIKKTGKLYYEESVLKKFFTVKVSGKVGKVISFANQKGGVGKTTTCLNLAFALNELGKRVLVIDFDPQANLSGLFTSPDDLTGTIANLLDLKEHGFSASEFDDVVIDTGYFDLLPSNIQLANFETPREIDAYDKIREFVAKYRTSYDYLLIDCPPTLDIKLLNSLMASDLAIVPCRPARFSIQGLKDLRRSVTKIQKKNPDLKAYCVINEYDERKQVSIAAAYIESHFPVLNVRIADATDIEKAQLEKQPLSKSNRSKFEDYIKLAEEIISL